MSAGSVKGGIWSPIHKNDITLVMDTSSNTIVGMMVLQGCDVSHLYVHVGYQSEGIGTQLMGLAKTCSEGYLELFTFQRNKRAQAFYVKHGWIEVARGFASADDNPWANSAAELADVKYVWRGAP